MKLYFFDRKLFCKNFMFFIDIGYYEMLLVVLYKICFFLEVIVFLFF